MASSSLGIAITTYNRSTLVADLVDRIRRYTTTPIRLIICDDGSSDNTVDSMRSRGEAVITGRNRGIAWNKNRGIWYLTQIAHVDNIILLDDDVAPVRPGWEREWIAATNIHGHVNFALPEYMGHVKLGACVPERPGISEMICGCALAFRRSVLASIGFMDPRFERYGHEHSDLSRRAVKAGFGGLIVDDGDEKRMYFYVISGNIESRQAPTSGTAADLNANSELLASLSQDAIFRTAWRSDAERHDFLREIQESLGVKLACDNRFNPSRYLEKNNDLSEKEIDPLYHFVMHGRQEGRMF